MIGWRARVSFVLGAVAFIATAPARAEWPTEGGDQGEVVKVVSLEDSGPGTLRDAIDRGPARRIVFAVSGEIFLRTPLVIRHANVTIAGDTAPTPGITLIGDKLRIRTHDVIVRDIRFRVGELPGPNLSNRDGISIETGKDPGPVGNVLIDRCSVAWAVDETIAIWGQVNEVLIRRTIIAEGLSHSVHQKGEHSMGLLVGASARDIVIEQNLFADNMFRNPVIDAGATAVVVNNLIYNPGWSGFHVYAKPKYGPTIASVVGNVLVAGPDTRDRVNSFPKGVNPGSEFFYSDNRAVGTTAFTTTEPVSLKNPAMFVKEPPIWFDWINVLPADQVEATVLAGVGARPQDRDETDRRLIAEVTSRTGSIKDTPVDPRLRVPRPLPDQGAAQ